MKNIELDFGGLTKQFEGLNGRHPGLWPIAPKALLLTGVVAAIVVGGWFAYWSGLNEELESTAAQEQVLKDEYTQKVAKAVNLDDLRRQKVLARFGGAEEVLCRAAHCREGGGGLSRPGLVQQ